MTRLDPADADARALAVLAAHDGIAHVSAFDAAGLTRNQTAATFRRGVLTRPRIGWYADPALPWQVQRSIRVGGVAACVTAAVLLGLPVPPNAQRILHVLVDEHATRLRHSRDRTWVLASVQDDAEVVLHRGACVDAARLGRTGLVDTLLLLAGCVPADWFVAALDAALRRPRDGEALLSPAGLARLAKLLPVRKQELLRLVDPRSESPLESLLRLALWRRGVTDFVLQAVPHPAYRVDFLIGSRLIVEVDGAAFHDPVADRIRDDVLRSLGYTVLRFGYDRIVGDIDAVVDEILAAL